MTELRTDPDLIPFLAPSNVAVVGASRNPRKLGYGLARNISQSGFAGNVYLVNPSGGKVLGRDLWPDISSIGEPIDLALLVVPAADVVAEIEQGAAAGIGNFVVLSGGFRETGEEGAQLEAELAEAADRLGVRVLGPNCVGTIDTHLPVDMTFLPPPGPTPGSVAFISHSGAICAAVIDWARGQGFGLSRLVSLGNQTNVTETHILETVAADPNTAVVTLYLEGVGDGRAFVEAASRVAHVKPIVALKVGRFGSGRKAVASHTGALAGEDRAFDAAFRRAGVLRASSSEEMFDWARALSWCPLPTGNRVAVLTNAGGPGVTAADALESLGLLMADFEPATRDAMAAMLPAAASLANPVDILASGSPEEFSSCLEILLEDSGVDMVMVIMPPPPMFTAAGIANLLIPVIEVASKPVVVALMGDRLVGEAAERFRAARVPDYRFPERAASALAVLARRSEWLRESDAAEEETTVEINIDQIRKILHGHPDGFIDSDVAFGVLSAAGIEVAAGRLARDGNEAVTAAESVGFPVVMKIEADGVVHKSDVGGVALNLETSTAVAQAFDQMMKSVRTQRPDADVHGVTIAPMISGGQEVIVGSVTDAQFGALAMFGTGGVAVELDDDVAFGLAPISGSQADAMIDATKAGKRLAGFRHIGAVNRLAARDVLESIARLAADFPEIEEVEINPLIVQQDRAIAADVRLSLRS